MIFFVILIASSYGFDKSVLKSGLESVGGQIKLFSSWMQAEHKEFDNTERAYRFRVFRKNLKEIVELNSAQNKYDLDANFMAGLTKKEQQKWYGINITAFPIERTSDSHNNLLSSMPTASEKFWRTEGKITAVKNQGGCGSCWAFAGIGVFEGHYAIKTGMLKTFAEQEFLDCTYENRDGCRGGWYWQAYDVLKNTQHLSSSHDYPYTARDGACLTSSTPNSMTGAKLKNVVRIVNPTLKNDATLVTALSIGPVAMAFEIKSPFNYYKKGILSIDNCGRTPHHAMTVTGYNAAFFEIKNSWGSGWGDAGYVRFDRNIQNMCGIFNWLAYPDLEKSGTDVKPHPNIGCAEIGLKFSRNGVDNFVSATNKAQSYHISSDVTWFKSWEKFAVEQCPGKTICIKSAHGRYLSAQPDGSLEWDRTEKLIWEYFSVEKHGDKIALKSWHNRYVSVTGTSLDNSASTVGDNELFSLHPDYCLA